MVRSSRKRPIKQIYNAAPHNATQCFISCKNAHATLKKRQTWTTKRIVEQSSKGPEQQACNPSSERNEAQVDIRALQQPVYANSSRTRQKKVRTEERRAKLSRSLNLASDVLRRRPPSRNFNPLRQTASLFAFDVDNVGVTLAPTPDAILFLFVPRFPVIIFFLSLLVVLGGQFQERRPRQLAGRRIGRTVLDCGVSVAEVAEVVDVVDAEERAGS